MDLGAIAGGAIGYAVGGAPGAAVGASIGGGIDTNAANADRADANNAWSAQQYATRYQTQVADLKAAGLNPMLAYSQSPGSAPTAQQVQFQNPWSGAAAAYKDVTSGDQNVASAAQANAQVKQIEATVDKIKEETKNIPIEGDRLKYAIQLLSEQAAKTAQEGETQVSIRKQLAATVQKLHAEAKLLGFDISATEKLDNFGREYKQYSPIIDLIKSIFQPRSGGITINK
jgi:hypothetical protein